MFERQKKEKDLTHSDDMRQLNIVKHSVFFLLLLFFLPMQGMLHDVAVAVFLRDLSRRTRRTSGLTTPKFDVLTIRPLATPSHCEKHKISSDLRHFLPRL